MNAQTLPPEDSESSSLMAGLKKDAGKLTRHLKRCLPECSAVAGSWISWLFLEDEGKGQGKCGLHVPSIWYQKAKEGGQPHEWSPSHLTLPIPNPAAVHNPHPGKLQGKKTSALLWATKP